MSNHRKPPLVGTYRAGFLRSGAWFARRDAWFATQATAGQPLACIVCGQEATKSHLELHHLDYTAVRINAGQWIAGEAHQDLAPMHPYCHDLLHRLIDRDVILSRHRTRRDATHIAIDRLRDALAPLTEGAAS